VERSFSSLMIYLQRADIEIWCG